jgi:hypothetical protein
MQTGFVLCVGTFWTLSVSKREKQIQGEVVCEDVMSMELADVSVYWRVWFGGAEAYLLY